MKTTGHTARYKASVKLVPVLCVLLVVLVGVVQATHVHTENSKLPSHECSMCSVAHAGVLNNVVCPPVPVFVRTVLVVVSDPIAKSSEFVSSLHIRPPPAA